MPATKAVAICFASGPYERHSAAISPRYRKRREARSWSTYAGPNASESRPSPRRRHKSICQRRSRATLNPCAQNTSLIEFVATASRQQHQRLVVPRADADGRKVTPVRGEHSRDAPALGHGRDHAIDQTKLQLVELGIELG